MLTGMRERTLWWRTMLHMMRSIEIVFRFPLFSVSFKLTFTVPFDISVVSVACKHLHTFYVPVYELMVSTIRTFGFPLSARSPNSYPPMRFRATS